MANVPSSSSLSSSSLKTFFLGLCLLFYAAHLFFNVNGSVAAGFTGKSPLHHNASIHRSAPIAVVKRFGALYAAKMLIGSKKDKSFLSISTSRSFNWVLCEPCSCYDTADPIFNPMESKTYAEYHCTGSDQYCSLLRENECDENNKCKFTFRYHDSDAYVNGTLALDKLRFQSTRGTIQLESFTFGCTHQVYGTHGTFSEDSYGIIGLGRGPLSLASQFANGIFSYCLPPKIGKEGWLDFMPAAMDPGHGAVTIPLVDHKKDKSTLYKVNIHSINIIGKEDDPIIMTKPHGVDQAAKQGSEFVIDTGTPLSYIGDHLMQKLLQLVNQSTPFPTIFHSQYDICFNITTTPPRKPPLPWIKLGFAGDVVVHLNPSNLFVRAGPYISCFTFVTIHRIGREAGFILGSEALKGRDMVIDSKKNEVTFGPLLEEC